MLTLVGLYNVEFYMKHSVRIELNKQQWLTRLASLTIISPECVPFLGKNLAEKINDMKIETKNKFTNTISY